MKAKARKTVPRRSHKDSANERKEARISPEEESRLMGLTSERRTSRQRTPSERQPRPTRSSIRH